MVAAQVNKRSERQKQILEATLELVATHGLLKTSISKISERANCSAGIVYHYFTSKDEIMDTLFLDIFGELMSYVLDDDMLERPASERYKELWLRKYRFHFNNPQYTVFLEQYKNSSYYTQEQQQEVERLMSGLVRMAQHDIERGDVVALPLGDIYTLTFTVALNLAKSYIQAGHALDDETLEMIAERVCATILA